MSVEETRAVVDRFWDEVWNKRNFAIGDKLLTDDVVINNFNVISQGREAQRQSTPPFFSGFPDLTVNIEFTITEEDKVAVRWTAKGIHNDEFQGIPPTGKPINIAVVAIYRVDGGKIIEGWSQPDALGLMQQIGVIPSQWTLGISYQY